MLVFGSVAGVIERRVGSKPPAIAGACFALASFVVLLTAHDTKAPIYLSSALLGIGVGLAFSAMANLIVHAVPSSHTGVATGMNTVARSLGGAFGGQIAATFVAGSVGASGLPTVHGFNSAFVLAIVALVIAIGAGSAIPSSRKRDREFAMLPEPA
jgi:MFS family permease